MKFQGNWLVQGYFQVKNPAGGPSLTELVRNELADRLGRPRKAVGIKSYPVGPAWRHTFWWREGVVDYAEPQFFAHISKEYPVLSIGVSVEKGLEVEGNALRASEKLNRNTWAWQRLVDHAADVLQTDVPACASRLARPVAVRFFTYDLGQESDANHQTRTFVFRDGAWSERHVGTSSVEKVVEHLHHLDTRANRWVDVYFACDLGPGDVDGMTPESFVEVLLHFDGLRRNLGPGA